MVPDESGGEVGVNRGECKGYVWVLMLSDKSQEVVLGGVRCRDRRGCRVHLGRGPRSQRGRGATRGGL